MRNTLLASLGGVGAAFLGALCCAGPILFVTLGVGAGLAGMFEPLRPLFGVLMIGLFALGFYSVYGEAPVAGAANRSRVSAEACTARRSRTREKALLWAAMSFALVFWTFPSWSIWLV